ncbi:MAG: hypothetical protein AB8B51_14385 [Sedimentitalea sp.]
MTKAFDPERQSASPLVLDEPTPTLWSEQDRRLRPSALDSETALALACHLGDAFADARNWDDLLSALSARDFGLEFQGTRLVLINERTGVALCACARLGHGFASLAARFGKPNVIAPSGRLVVKPA